MPRKKKNRGPVQRPAYLQNIGRISVADVVVRNNPGIVQSVFPSEEGKPKTTGPVLPTVISNPDQRTVEAKPVSDEISKLMPPTVVATPVQGAPPPSDLWQRAKANADYYIDRCLKDECRKFWFQYPRYEYQYSEHVLVSPDMVDDLFKYSAQNRIIDDLTVDQYQRDIENNRWIQTHESFAVDLLGRAYDFQHRGTAIKKAKKAWPMYFTWNTDPASILVCDSGKSRPIRTRMKLVLPQISLAGKVDSVCRAMMRGVNTIRIKWGINDIGEFAIKHKEMLAWLAENFPTNARVDVQAAVGKAFLWWGPDKLLRFCDQYRRQVWDEDDPAQRVFLFVNSSRAKGEEPISIYLKVCNALTKEVAGEKIDKLYEGGSDIFTWEPGWEVPSDAPRFKAMREQK